LVLLGENFEDSNVVTKRRGVLQSQAVPNFAPTSSEAKSKELMDASLARGKRFG